MFTTVPGLPLLQPYMSWEAYIIDVVFYYMHKAYLSVKDMIEKDRMQKPLEGNDGDAQKSSFIYTTETYAWFSVLAI